MGGGDARGSLDGQLDRLGRSAQVNGWNHGLFDREVH